MAFWSHLKLLTTLIGSVQSIRPGQDKIPTSNMALKQQHGTVEATINDTKMH